MGWRDPSRVGQPLSWATQRQGEEQATPSETQSDASPTDEAMAEHFMELAMGAQTLERPPTRGHQPAIQPLLQAVPKAGGGPKTTGTTHAVNDIAKQAPMRNLTYPPLPHRGGKPWIPPTPIRAAALQVSSRQEGRPVPQPKAPPRSLQQRRDKEQREVPPTQATKRTLHTLERHTKMLRAPKPARPSGAIHTAAEIQDKLRQQCIQDWIAILNHLGTESQLAIAMHNSSHGDTLARIAIQSYSPNTLSQYIRAIRIFLRGAEHHETPPSHFTLALMVDLLHECKEGSQQDRGVHKCTPALMIRAIGWLAQVQNLPALMSNPLIQAFGKPEGPRDRREALPLPLSTIAAWEEKIREPSTPHALRILLGAMLVAAHASLRFADMQRIKHSSLRQGAA